MRRMMSVVLDRGMERRRWEGQGNVSLIIDRIDAFGFRVSAMPVGTRVKAGISRVSRNLHDEVRILLLAWSDDQDNFLINLLCPSLRSIEPHPVQHQLVL